VRERTRVVSEVRLAAPSVLALPLPRCVPQRHSRECKHNPSIPLFLFLHLSPDAPAPVPLSPSHSLSPCACVLCQAMLQVTPTKFLTSLSALLLCALALLLLWISPGLRI
jgi:hypothetical protein